MSDRVLCTRCVHVITKRRVMPVVIGGRTIDSVDLGVVQIAGVRAYECDRKPIPLEDDYDRYTKCYNERKHGRTLAWLLGECGEAGRFYESDSTVPRLRSTGTPHGRNTGPSVGLWFWVFLLIVILAGYCIRSMP